MGGLMDHWRMLLDQHCVDEEDTCMCMVDIEGQHDKKHFSHYFVCDGGFCHVADYRKKTRFHFHSIHFVSHIPSIHSYHTMNIWADEVSTSAVLS